MVAQHQAQPSTSARPGGGGPDPVAAAKALAANRHASELFAWTFMGLIFFFSFLHFLKLYILIRHDSRDPATKAVFSRLKPITKILHQKVPKFPTTSHALLIFAYFGLNALFTFWDMEFEGRSPYSFFAKRCGWLAITNCGLVLLLAMKNNPLAILTGYSHEALNFLHRWAGRVVWFYSALHTITYAIILSQHHRLHVLREPQQIYGWVAFAAFTVLILTSFVIVRIRFYGPFFIVHIFTFLVAIIFTTLHKPHKYWRPMVGLSILWLFDRIVRTAYKAYNSYCNVATLIPLPGYATKITFKRSFHFIPAQHAFLTIPATGSLKGHPFTISSASETEFIMRAHKPGQWAAKVHELAMNEPGRKLRVILDGPYGAVPEFKLANRVVLIAGGIGGAFLFPVAVDLARHAGRSNVVKATAIWAIRDETHMQWFENEIEELKRSEVVALKIYVDGAIPTPTSRSRVPTPVPRDSTGKVEEGKPSTEDDDGDETEVMDNVMLGFPVIHQTPDVRESILEAVDEAEARDVVMVAACGPPALTHVARAAVVDSMKPEGPDVSIHCEHFGWG